MAQRSVARGRAPARRTLWLALGLALATAVCAFAACRGIGGRFAADATATPTRTPRAEPWTPIATVTASPLPTEAASPPPAEAPADQPTVAAPATSTETGADPVQTLEAALPTPTPSATPSPVPPIQGDDPLGDEVEALLEELLRLFDQADALDDLPGS